MIFFLCPPPRQINVGSGFQAAVPELGGCARSPPTPGGATLAWSPWPGLEGDPTTQRQGEAPPRTLKFVGGASEGGAAP